MENKPIRCDIDLESGRTKPCYVVMWLSVHSLFRAHTRVSSDPGEDAQQAEEDTKLEGTLSIRAGYKGAAKGRT